MGKVKVDDDDLPPELFKLRGLMAALGWEWSNHYWPPSNPKAKWSMVRPNGGAGRVGMTVSEAEDQVLRSATAALYSAENIIWNAHRDLDQVSKRLHDSLVKR